jgi:hypothetical protein
MNSLTTVVTVNPDVVHTPLPNGEAVLLQMSTSHYFTLNTTGAQIWEMLSQGSSYRTHFRSKARA